MTDATWKSDFRPGPPSMGEFVSKNNIRLYVLGEEAEWLMTFQKVAPQDFLEAVYEYELTVEGYDSKAEWDDVEEGYDITVRAVEYKPHDEKFDGWSVTWGPDCNVDTLVTILSRW